MEEIKKIDREKILKSFLDNKELLDKRNEEGIEKYRKGEFTIKFLNEDKKEVTVKQTKHKFLFGTTAFMLNSFEKEEKEVIYKEKFVNLFNQAVVPFYWSDLEPEEGKLRFRKDTENVYRRPQPDLVLEFCKEYGIEPKGHCLLWNKFVPDWLEKYSKEERKKIVERRFKEIADEYSSKIPSFDIVNESASNYRRGLKFLFEDYDEYGLMLGGKYFSNNTKILNETNTAIWRDYRTEGKYMAFNMQLKDFINKGLPIDEIGLQYHIFNTSEEMEGDMVIDTYLNVEYLLEILEIFDNYGLPMHVSEITVPGSGQNEENEEIQAYLVEELYKTWFATRNMKSIVWWNLVDGYAAYAPLGTNLGENRCGGGLLRFDMTEKPAYKVLDRLINKEWKTNFIKTVNNNELKFKGFYGEYEIIVDGKSHTVNLDENGKEIVL
ncbi:MAG: endo-1,4-beta-xylanase [Clostridia bacterium]|nr:endo-1,4-beta-xylanase [Clostridia bacterium]